MFEYKINVCNNIQKRYIYASDGSWIWFEDNEEATEEQKQTHVAYEQSQIDDINKQKILSRLSELDKIVSRKDEERHKLDLKLVELGIIIEQDLPYWDYDDVVAEKERLRAKL